MTARPLALLCWSLDNTNGTAKGTAECYFLSTAHSRPAFPPRQPQFDSSACDDCGVAACPLSSALPVSLPPGSFGGNYSPAWPVRLLGDRKSHSLQKDRGHKTLKSCSFMGPFRETELEVSWEISQIEIRGQNQAGREAFAMTSSRRRWWQNHWVPVRSLN